MSIEILLAQKGLLKSTMPLQVLLGKELQYGRIDNGQRLEAGKTDEDGFLAFLPDAIGRGISVTWNPQEKRCIVLRALTPSTEAELRALYAMVGRITDYWNCVLEADGSRMTSDAFQAGLADMLDFDRRALAELSRKILTGESETLTLFSAKWPLVLGREEAQMFLDDPISFGAWLHTKQSVNAYFAVPFYTKAEGTLGKYILTEGKTSILPKQPYVPLGYIDPETEEPLKCGQYAITLCSAESGAIGTVPYDTFLARLPAAKTSRFDGGHILVEALTAEEMKAMCGSAASACKENGEDHAI